MVENKKNNLEQSDSQAENAENQMQQEPVNVEMTETENANTSSQAVQETATEVITETVTPVKKANENQAVDVNIESDPAFDWNKYEEGDYQTELQKTDLEKMYNETLSAIKVNEVVEGTVISMNKREVVVNIGYKSEGVVSLNEFRYNPELANRRQG